MPHKGALERPPSFGLDVYFLVFLYREYEQEEKELRILMSNLGSYTHCLTVLALEDLQNRCSALSPVMLCKVGVLPEAYEQMTNGSSKYCSPQLTQSLALQLESCACTSQCEETDELLSRSIFIFVYIGVGRFGVTPFFLSQGCLSKKITLSPPTSPPSW